MSIEPKYKTISEAKTAGWFSRRHQTNKEHLEVQKKRADKKANMGKRY